MHTRVQAGRPSGRRVLGPSPHRRRRLSALVLTAVAVAGAVATARSASTSAGLFDLPPRARATVQADLAAVTPAAAAVVRRIQPSLQFDEDVASCGPPAASCVSSPSGATGPWRIHVDAQTTAFTYPSNRFLVYHEIGHAVWGLVLGPDGRQAFVDAVRATLHGRPCLDDRGDPCASVPEMFADEFARFAGGFAVSMSYYETPALLDPATLGRLVGAPVQSARPAPTYLQRPVYDRGRIRLVQVRADAANVREDRGISVAPARTVRAPERQQERSFSPVP